MGKSQYCQLLLSLCLGSTGLLGLGLHGSFGLTQTVPSSNTPLTAACRNELFFNSFTQWQRLSTLRSFAHPEDLAQIQTLIRQAQGDPRRSQVAIDRLTPSADLDAPPQLLVLIRNTPSDQRARVLPLVEQFVVLARALPPGHNYVQSRALIAAAQAYGELGQAARSGPLLQQASQTLVGIAIPVLKAEVQWRWGQAWASLGQPQQQTASLAAIATTLKTPSRPTPSQQGQRLISQLLDRFIQRQQIAQAEAIARTIPALPQRIREQFRIVAVYLRARQVQPALTLFNQTIASIPQTSRLINPELSEIVIQGIITVAQVGGITTASQGMNQLLQLSALQRAQAWLAIAGEARRQNRPQESARALARLIDVGRQGQQQQFNNPYGFSGLGPNPWGRSLYELSQMRGYQPEFNQFIQQLQIQSEAVEFLIAMAVQAQQFDQAEQLIPSPLMFRNAAGSFDVGPTWRLWVAVAAAEAGKPQPLIALAEQAVQQLPSGPAQSITFVDLPASFRRDPPFVEVIDLPIGALSPEYTVLVAIPILQQQGQSAAARSLTQTLVDRLTAITKPLLGLAAERRFADNQFPLAWIGMLEQTLRLYEQAESADRLAALQSAHLQQIADPERRVQTFAEQALLSTAVPDLAAEIARFSAGAKAAGVADHPRIAQRIVAVAIIAGKPELAANWQARARLSPREQSELWSERINAITYGSDASAVLNALDQAVALYRQDPTGPQSLDSQRASQWIDIYLRFGQVAKARSIIELISDSQLAGQWAARLSCLDF